MLEVVELSKTYGNGPGAVKAIDHLSFAVEPGEFVGPSARRAAARRRCSNALSGLLRPTAGEARFDQEYSRSLLPWLTVAGNVTLRLPLRHKRIPKPDRARLGADALAAVGLDGFGPRYPWQLSGGMQQRGRDRPSPRLPARELVDG